MSLSTEKGSSSWLSTLLIAEHGFALHKIAFCDALCLSIDWLASIWFTSSVHLWQKVFSGTYVKLLSRWFSTYMSQRTLWHHRRANERSHRTLSTADHWRTSYSSYSKQRWWFSTWCCSRQLLGGNDRQCAFFKCKGIQPFCAKLSEHPSGPMLREERAGEETSLWSMSERNWTWVILITCLLHHRRHGSCSNSGLQATSCNDCWKAWKPYSKTMVCAKPKRWRPLPVERDRCRAGRKTKWAGLRNKYLYFHGLYG